MTSELSPTFDASGVVRRTFGAFGANLPLFVGLALILFAAPTVAQTWIAQTYAPPGSPLGFVAPIVLGIAAEAITCIAKAVIFIKTMDYLSARTTPVSGILNRIFSAWWKLWLVNVIVVYASAAASIVFIIPGILLGVRWIVAAPVVIFENTTAFDALGRSRDLTKGRRWPIFGLILVYFLIVIVGEVMLLKLAVAPDLKLLAGLASPKMRYIVSPIISTVTAPLMSAGLAVAYWELSKGRERADPAIESVAAAFD